MVERLVERVGGKVLSADGVRGVRARADPGAHEGRARREARARSASGPLLVSIKNSKGTRAIVPGDAIDLAIDPEDIHVLQR
jgi:hypothetical protein